MPDAIGPGEGAARARGPAAASAQRLVAFVQRYLELVGARAVAGDADLMEVELPDPIAAELGRRRLVLAFARAALDDHPEAQMVTYGAPIVNAIARSLTERGDLRKRVLWPPRVVRPGPPIATNARMEAGPTLFRWGTVATVTHRLTLLADEAQEHLVGVTIDDTGLPPGVAERLATSDVGVPLREGHGAGPQGDPSRGDRDEAWLDPPASIEGASLLERARTRLAELVRPHVEEFRRIKDGALAQQMARLEAHRRAQRQELSASPTRRARLELEALDGVMQRRIDEERERLRVVVKATPLCVSVAHIPVVEERWEYMRESPPVEVRLELVGTPLAPATLCTACKACGAPLVTAAVCEGGHLVHPTCMRNCAGCGSERCAPCALPTCIACQRPVCAPCQRTCGVCRALVCPNHGRPCPACDTVACRGHTAQCGLCLQVVCHPCLERSAARGRPVCLPCRAVAPRDRWSPALDEILASPEARAHVGDRTALAGLGRHYAVVIERRWLWARLTVLERPSGRPLHTRTLPPWRLWGMGRTP